MSIREVFFKCLIIALLTASAALAQGVETTPSAAGNTQSEPASTTQPYLKGFLRDEWDLWGSLVKKDSYSSHSMKKYGIPFALLSGVLIATDSRTAEFLPNNEDQKRWSGRVSQGGAAYTLGAVSGGTYFIGKITGNRHAQETGLLALHAIGHSQIVTATVKQLTNRRRPVVLTGTAGFWNGGDSFPSGHASTSFAVATVFAYEYRHRLVVPIVSYTVASAIAASRVGAQRHWLSDIVVGGSTGFLVGRYVYKRHHDSSLPGSAVPPKNRLVPKVSFNATRLALDWQF
jgi:membrane-associated phospholipid phosphatase